LDQASVKSQSLPVDSDRLPVKYNFYRKGSFSHLMRFNYGNDDTYTNLQSVFVNKDNLQAETSSTLDDKNGMYVTLSNCKFYSNVYRSLDIWYDGGILGNNVLEIVGTSIANSDSLYGSDGSTLTILGNSAFIEYPYEIVDPILIQI
jgi:hypothetical protein